jgi:hypothetical protein
MRNFLIIVAGVLLLNAFLLYSGGFDYVERQFTTTEPPLSLEPEVVDIFRDTLETRVREEVGTPIEGYEPQMFLDVFPGLVPSDFDGVEASIGVYSFSSGRLVHVPDNTKLVHSAAGAISRRGMETLYRNVAARSNIDVTKGGALTSVMAVVTGE